MSRAWASFIFVLMFIGGFFVGTIIPVMAVLSVQALVTHFLWKWFITPLYAVPAPEFTELLGLLLIVRLLLWKVGKGSGEPEVSGISDFTDRMKHLTLMPIAAYLMMLCIGYLIWQFL